MITWSFVEPLRDEMSVEEFEADYGVVFPAAYNELVRDNNNGYPSKDAFTLPSGESFRMNHLYSFNRDDSENMWDFNSNANLEAGFIAFADDSFGNQIGIRIADNAIVFADYDAYEITVVAEDFSAFLCQLNAPK